MKFCLTHSSSTPPIHCYAAAVNRPRYTLHPNERNGARTKSALTVAAINHQRRARARANQKYKLEVALIRVILKQELSGRSVLEHKKNTSGRHNPNGTPPPLTPCFSSLKQHQHQRMQQENVNAKKNEHDRKDPEYPGKKNRSTRPITPLPFPR